MTKDSRKGKYLQKKKKGRGEYREKVEEDSESRATVNEIQSALSGKRKGREKR